MDLDEVTKILDGEKRVKLAYLFGSAARDEMTGISDIDIGVYLDKSLSGDERFKMRLELISKLDSALEKNEVDLVVMNDSPLLLN